ncbi:DUF1684 domain-containing protein [Stygiobacter electus]|uniref:DUF1684 domain-containing protein n=1 Tax=Stygiobacter electus TaxID=3032292 RepID=A0AAE3TE99_9BACT|nr:DUF1684 domain-containing protein [Stygiobacter electus]MDF1612048.1 DUF1684 domain-containing protein [Stygiobacter electus]
MKKYLSLSLIIYLLFACGESLKEKGSKEYISEIKSWHNKRIENLKKENGWLNLIGLLWLKDGENKFGSDKSNDVVFPEPAPKFMGKFILKDTLVTVEINPDVEVTNSGEKITSLNLQNDLKGNPTVLAYKNLRWYIIKRGPKYGVRLRDLEAPLVKNFKGIETFPINEDWKIEAKFVPYNPMKNILIQNILGMIDTSKAAGKIYFKKDGKEFSLEALDGGEDSFFIIFGDETSGNETYGAGRFLSVEKPKEGQKFYIDFNKAYNPPCVFTKYATCPLPPKENLLKLRITAGEKMFKGGGH